MNAKTHRQQIIECLETEKMNAMDLSKEIRLSEKEIYQHLEHIVQTVKSSKKKFKMEPCECRLCNYVFDGRKRLTKPGRCPNCKQGSIENAIFWIEVS